MTAFSQSAADIKPQRRPLTAKRLLNLCYTKCEPVLSVVVFRCIWGLLWLLEPVFPIRIGNLKFTRIGHTIEEPDLFLRRLDAGLLPKRAKYFFIIGNHSVSNQAVVDMLKRHINIIQSNGVRRLYDSIYERFNKCRFHVPMHEPTWNEPLYQPLYTRKDAKVYFQLSAAEMARGRRELQEKYGIGPDDWFMCFHTRDSAYLNRSQPDVDNSYHNFRDAPIATYLKAAKFITSQGGYAIRMGSVVEEPLGDTGDPRIIDYATTHRSEFLDLYILSQCRMYLGSSAGLFCIPAVFGRPTAYANGLPICNPWGRFTMFIPKKLYKQDEGRYLSFREAPERYNIGYWGEDYAAAKVCAEPNTADEILDLCQEMYAVIEGRQEPDRALQAEVNQAMGPHHSWARGTSFISSQFIKANRRLFEI